MSRLLRALTGPFGEHHDEDCLYLNVWTPAVDGRRRPVLVWIHGGAFVLGSGSTRFYSGSRLARRGDVVVVTLNYRLGALGFLHLPASGGPGGEAVSNLGIRDQIAALRWVRDNIEAFGGDPDNLTVFGESAGAMSVATLLGAPEAQGLVRRAILQSGAAHHVSTAEGAQRVAHHFLAQLGAGDDLEVLRRVPVQRILAAQRHTILNLPMSGGRLPWQPAIDGDLLPEAPLDAIERGVSKSIDVLFGTNRDEWKLFMVGDRAGHRLDEAGLRRRMQRALSLDGREDLLEAAFEAYRRSALAREAEAPRERWVAFQTDRVFRHPALALADRHARHGGATWGYLFTWSPPLLRGRIGACHALEIPFVFGTLREPVYRPLMAAAGRAAFGLSTRMQDAWLHFARSGDPSHDGLGEWTRYAADQRRVMRLGASSSRASRPGGRFRPRMDAETFRQADAFWTPLR